MDITELTAQMGSSVRIPGPEPGLVQAVASQTQLKVDASSANGSATGDDESPPLERKEAERIVKAVQDQVDAKGVKLSFKLLENNDNLQVEVKDAGTGKVIRKIPGDEIVKLEQSIKAQSRGIKESYV